MSLLPQSVTTQAASPVGGEFSSAHAPIKVMIVDDSAVVRGLVARWLAEEPGLEVVARHSNGKCALDDLADSNPDVILLDIEMPVMDGLETLPHLLRARPGTRVIMVSTLTKRNAEISFKALSLGALDYIPKPDTNRDITLQPDFRREIVYKVKTLGRERLQASGLQAVGSLAQKAPPPPVRLGPFSLVPPRTIAIGSSTGGPPVLTEMLATLSPSLGRVSVLVTQHMPPMFTTILAERLSRATGREAKEGVHGEPVKPGTIYVAPGGQHMSVIGSSGPAIRLGSEPPVHFCRPAVDPLFASVAASFGPAALGIVLTGMGHDGAAGARAIAAAGGSVIAQDRQSSAVWGMPAAAAAAGACAAILPPAEIAGTAMKLIQGQRP
jgi:two-component system chemotaxis response regulator CheB